MLVSNTKIMIPTRTVVEDLISRDGSPTTESLSPYNGLRNFICTRFQNVEFDGSILRLFADQQDFNADKIKPWKGEYEKDDDNISRDFKSYNPWSEEEPEYLRRLEDIDSSFIHHYVENLVYSVSHYSTNSIPAYNRSNPVERVFAGQGDDEGFVEENELLTTEDKNSYTASQIAEAKNKLPYYLKRVHLEGMNIGIQLFSILRANECAKNSFNDAESSRRTKSVQKPTLLRYGVYPQDKYSGEVIPNKLGYTANKNSRSFNVAWEWLFGDSETRQDANKLLHLLEVLGIDICQEDPLVYTKSFIDEMAVQYITDNVSYISRRHVIESVRESLKTLDLGTNAVIVQKDKNISVQQRIEMCQRAFYSSVFSNENMTTRASGADSKAIQEELARFIYVYNQHHAHTYKLEITKDTRIIDGFYYDKMGYNPILVDVNSFIQNKTDMRDCYAVLNVNGYLVLISNSMAETRYCSLQAAIDYIEFGDTVNRDWSVLWL